MKGQSSPPTVFRNFDNYLLVDTAKHPSLQITLRQLRGISVRCTYCEIDSLLFHRTENLFCEMHISK